MRIIAGAHKGCRLVTPGGANTRPTSDRVKESVFSMLDGYGVVQAANVLDLFAGSGGLGLEAMSRGAAVADFVDSAAASARAIAQNAGKMGVTHSVRIHTVDVITFLAGLRARGETDDRVVDLVFMDPPYPLGEDAVTQVLGLVSGLLDHESIIVLERSTRSPEPTLPAGLEVFRSKAFGETTVRFLQLEGEGE